MRQYENLLFMTVRKLYTTIIALITFIVKTSQIFQTMKKLRLKKHFLLNIENFKLRNNY